MRAHYITIVSLSIFSFAASTLHASARYIRQNPVNNQPVIIDTITNYMWQGCAAGLSSLNCTSGDSMLRMNWSEAISYCEALDWGGFSDWQLPDIKTLSTIVDDRRVFPAIDETAFPRYGAYFYSSTSNALSPRLAWSVDFYFGTVRIESKEFRNTHVRCVRTGR